MQDSRKLICLTQPSVYGFSHLIFAFLPVYSSSWPNFHFKAAEARFLSPLLQRSLGKDTGAGLHTQCSNLSVPLPPRSCSSLTSFLPKLGTRLEQQLALLSSHGFSSHPCRLLFISTLHHALASVSQLCSSALCVYHSLDRYVSSHGNHPEVTWHCSCHRASGITNISHFLCLGCFYQKPSAIFPTCHHSCTYGRHLPRCPGQDWSGCSLLSLFCTACFLRKSL